MKNKLSYAEEAWRDLDEIWERIAALAGAGAADRTVDGIMDDIEGLETYAELGPLLESIADVESDYRFLVCGKYLVFYRTEGNRVFIDRVLYGRRDYLGILFGDRDAAE